MPHCKPRRTGRAMNSESPESPKKAETIYRAAQFCILNFAY